MRDDTTMLDLDVSRPVEAANGGLFVCRGEGRHPDRVIRTWELIFVRRGVLKMMEEGRPLTIREGGTLLLWPGRRHWGAGPYPKNLSFYWIHFQLPAARRRVTGASRVMLSQTATPRRPDRLMELMHWFLDDQESGRSAAMPANLLVTLMLLEVASSGDGVVPTAGAALADRADAHLAAHAHQMLSTSTVARVMGCHPDHLGRVYRSQRGVTLTDAIHQVRLRDARRLMLDSDLNIDQIAAQCGFASAGYFRRIFERHHGITPLRFRRLHQRRHINWR
ncbi:MAG: AraC family transcriptional regulator [Phycisphaeraceae bacterium]|nr:AraC family transcriptional regulator [Phycisphaeraceae bacterium]